MKFVTKDVKRRKWTYVAPELVSLLTKIVNKEDIDQLESRVDELLRVVERLKDENQTLRKQQQELSSDRTRLLDRSTELVERNTQLVEKNKMARTRLESIIDRLRALEAR